MIQPSLHSLPFPTGDLQDFNWCLVLAPLPLHRLSHSPFPYYFPELHVHAKSHSFNPSHRFLQLLRQGWERLLSNSPRAGPRPPGTSGGEPNAVPSPYLVAGRSLLFHPFPHLHFVPPTHFSLLTNGTVPLCCWYSIHFLFLRRANS